MPAALALLLALAACGSGDDRPAYAPPRVPATPEVWAVGDAAIPTRAARRVAARVRAADPDLLLYLGDVYDHGSLDELRTRYEPLYGSLARRTAPTPGNHEWPRAREGYFPYWRDKLGRAPPLYYSFRAGSWAIVSLNSELRERAYERQLEWVRRLPPGDSCRLAFFHTPRFSAGFHGDEPLLDPLWRELRRRADVVVNGHDHDMQLLRPPGGPPVLVSGAGGSALHALHRDDPDLRWGDDRHHGALRMRLLRGRLRYAFMTAGGRVLRRGTLRCRD
jgi:hypothetical protein